MNKVKVGILEDHVLMAHLLKERIEKYSFVESVVVYESSSDFLSVSNKLAFDVLITDLIMPEVSGADIIKYVRSIKKSHELKIVVLSRFFGAKNIKQMIDLGANAFLAKNTNPEELELALAHVISTESVYIGTSLKEAIIQYHFDQDKNVRLTDKEKLVLDYLCKGHSVVEISGLMFLSTHSIQSYIKKLFLKFNVNKTKDLILKALEQKSGKLY